VGSGEKVRHSVFGAARAALALASLLALVTIFGSASAASAQDYEIKLTRSFKVGQMYRLSATTHKIVILNQLGGSGADNKRDEFYGVLEANAKVQAVNMQGSPTSLMLTISKCIKKVGDTEKILAGRDAIVIASVKGDRSTFTIDGKPADQDTTMVLGMMVPLGSSHPSEDDIYGTKQRVKVGDRWTPNTALMASDLAADSPGLKKEDVTGNVTLAKVSKVGGTDVMEVTAEANIGNVHPPAQKGVTVDKASVRTRYAAKVPVDPTKGPIEMSRESLQTSLARVRAVAKADEKTIEFSQEEMTTVTFTYPG
jgi:hypothetical protein